MEDEAELLARFRSYIKRKNIPSGNFVKAWVSHVVVPSGPIDNESELVVHKSGASEIEDDRTILYPSDSSSQVNCIGRKIQEFVNSISNPISKPSKRPVSPRVLRYVKDICDNDEEIAKPQEETAPFVSQQSPLLKKKPKISKLEDAKPIVAKSRSSVKSAAVVKSANSSKDTTQELLAMAQKLTTSFGPEGDRSAASDMFFADKSTPFVEHLKANNVEPRRNVISSETNETLLITNEFISTMVDNYTTLEHDDSFVEAVHAISFVFFKRFTKKLQEMANNDGRDFINRGDILRMFQKMGIQPDDAELRNIDTLFAF